MFTLLGVGKNRSIFNPSSILGLTQRFLDEDPTYYSSTIGGRPVFTPEETHTSIALPHDGRCWLFNGTNNFATRGARLTSGSVSALTVAAWIKVTDYANYNCICSEQRTTGSNLSWSFYTEQTDGRLAFYGSSNGTAFGAVLSTSAVGTGTWRHVVAVYNGATQTVVLYLNGTRVGTTTVGAVPASLFNSPEPFAVGAQNVSGTANGFFKGSLKDVIVEQAAWSDAEVLSLFNTHTVPAGKTPLAFFRCEEESGTTGYNSLSNSNHLTLTNITQSTFHAVDAGVRYSDANERGYSSVLSFDGVNDFAATGSPITSGSISALTISAWIKPTDFAASMVIAAQNRASINQASFNFFTQITTGRLRFTGSGNGSTTWIYESNTALTANTWSHVAVVYNGGAPTLYINRVPVAVTLISGSVTSTLFASTEPFAIGAQGVSNGTGATFFKGSIKDLVIEQAAWSDAEMLAFTPSGQVPAGKTPLGRYSSQFDESGNGRNLTLTGPVVTILPRSVATPTQDVEGALIGVTGPLAKLATAEVRCVTGDGSAVRVNVGSAGLSGSSDYSYSLYVYHVNNGNPQRLVDLRDNSSNRTVLYLDTNAAWGYSAGSVNIELDGGNVAVSSAITTATWHYIYVASVSGTVTVSVKNLTTGTTVTNSRASAHNFGPTTAGYLLGAYNNVGVVTSANQCASTISLFSVTQNGVTRFFPLQEGPGTANTNRNVHWVGSDGAGGVISNAIVNGTVSTMWANYCPFARDWCVENGGSHNPNMLSFTEAFDNVYWTKSNTTVTADNTNAPNGASTADKIAASSTGQYREVASTAISCVAGGAYSVSFYCKPDTVNWCYVSFSDYTANAYGLTFDIANGVVGLPGVNIGSGFTPLGSAIEAAANGFYRCTLRFRTDTARSYRMVCGVADGSGDTTVASGSSIFVWGAQLELGSVATPYQAVATTPNGSFIPGRIGSGLDAVGNAKTLVAGKHGNPYSRLCPNPFAMPSLVNIGYTAATKLAPTDAVQATSPADTKFRRNASDGSDRYNSFSTALTGTSKTNMEEYTA